MGDLTDNFSRHEFACNCGCGLDTVDHQLVLILEEVRAYYGRKITINSGCRCRRYNDRIGGWPRSRHLHCRAADFVVEGVRPHEVQSYLATKYDDRFGIGRYTTFTHFDTRTDGPARWRG